MPRMLDLFAGRFGWGRAFAARGWEVVGIDLVEPPEIPEGCTFIKADILQIGASKGRFNILEYGDHGQELWTFQPDFICASSPCEQFSIHGMKCFHPNPVYPTLGIDLFNHTRALCESSGLPYVMENVRAAQAFVGNAGNHCGPFYLWGNAIPPLLPQGISKGMSLAGGLSKEKISMMTADEIFQFRSKHNKFFHTSSGSMARNKLTAEVATIPPELASVVVDYAEYLIKKRNIA